MDVKSRESTSTNSIVERHRLTCDVLVLDAVLRQSLVAVRSLGRRGLRVAASEMSTHKSVPTFASRWCQQKRVYPAVEGTVDYLAYVKQSLEQTGARVIIPSSDGTISLLRKYRSELEGQARIALAKEPALSIAVDKEKTLEIASQLGIGIPRGIVVKAMDDVAAAVREIGLPVVIKPSESWIEQEENGARYGSSIATTLAEAQEVVEGPFSLGGSMLFQAFLPGRREAVNLFYADGEIHARFAQWAKRTEPQMGGVSVFRQGIAVPEDIGKQSERLVREIELEGYAEVEFRRDGAGKPYLMEINPRLSASVEIAVRSGVDFPYLLYQWASGGPIDHIKSYRPGRWMRYLRGDFFTTLEAIQHPGRPGVAPANEAVRDFLASFFIPSGYDYLDWQDIQPAIVSSTDFMKDRVGKGIVNKIKRLAR